MKTSELKAGVVYAHRTGQSGEYTPIILLDTKLWRMKRNMSGQGSVFQAAPPKEKVDLKAGQIWTSRTFVPTGYVALSIARYGMNVGKEIDGIPPEKYSDPEWRMEELRRFIPRLPGLVKDFSKDPSKMDELGQLVELTAVAPRNIAGTWEDVVGVYSARVAEVKELNAKTQETADELDSLAKALVVKVGEILVREDSANGIHVHGVAAHWTKTGYSHNREEPNWIKERARVSIDPETLQALLFALGVEVHS
jgi:hypothetical protein